MAAKSDEDSVFRAGHVILVCLALEDRGGILSLMYVSGPNPTPIADLFEAHLTVSELDRAVAFYRDLLALPLARVFPERRGAFFGLVPPGRQCSVFGRLEVCR